MKQGNIVFIRADLWNTTQALPKAIEASNSLFEKISILEWVKHPEKIESRAQTTPFSLFSYKGLISSNIITRALCVIRYLAWVYQKLTYIKPNFVHYIGIYNFPAVLLFKLFNPRTVVIYEIRDPYALMFRNKFVSFLIHKVDQVIMLNASYVIFPNKYLISYAPTPIPRDKIFVSPNFGAVNEEYRSLSFKKTKTNLGYFGYLSEDRGLRMLEKIAEYYKNEITLHIAGNHKESIEKVFNKYKNVINYGYLSRPESLNLMKSVDANLILYDPKIRIHSYMLPIKFFDSCMLGTPVILSKGMIALENEVIENQLGHSIEYMNHLDLDEVIQKMKINPVKSGRLQDYFVENCNYKLFMRDYYKFYTKIVSE